MSDQNSQEPTMEEILASIRRIISEDDAPAAAPEPGLAEAAHLPDALIDAPAAGHPAPAAAEPDDDVLELTDRLDEPAPPMESVGDLDVFAQAEPAPALAAPRPQAPRAEAAAADEEGLVGHPAANTAASAFGQLERSVLMPAEGRTLEDVVRELLRPLLKGWLDEHLPGIVQTAVEAEVERIARKRR